jgi:hypothetical protein
MPPGGAFAKLPAGSPLIIYVARRTADGPSESGRFRYGIYLSRDDGGTWIRISDGDDYGTVLLLRDGTLFAVTNPSASNGPSRVHQSRDMGKTWRDITGKGFGQIVDLFPDPDHPGLICLDVSAMRAYVLQAEDEGYRWKAISGSEWYRGRPLSTADFFNRTYGTTSTLHMLHSSLANYFEFDFGDQPSLPAFEIIPGRERFEFRRGERVSVPVRVVFRQNFESNLAEWKRGTAQGHRWPQPTPTTVTLIDQREDTALWGIRVERAGQRINKRPTDPERFRRVLQARDRAALREELLSDGKYEQIRMNVEADHMRAIDLGRLADFSEVGEYQVQLYYASGYLSDPAKGEWGGTFTSPVFRVIIKE